MKNVIYENSSDVKDFLNVILYQTSENIGTDSGIPQFHTSYEFLFCRKGSAVITVDGEKHAMNEGDVVCIRPFQIHFCEYAPNSLTFVIVMSETFVKALNAPEDTFFATHLHGTPELAEKLSSLLFLCDSIDRYCKDILLKKGFCSLFLHLLSSSFPLVNCSTLHKASLTDVLVYIDKNYAADVSLTHVASTFGYSSAYFSSVFHKITGMRFPDFVNLIRYKKTDLLLSERPELTVTCAALESGFDSMSTYYRTKRKYE